MKLIVAIILAVLIIVVVRKFTVKTDKHSVSGRRFSIFRKRRK